MNYIGVHFVLILILLSIVLSISVLYLRTAVIYLCCMTNYVHGSQQDGSDLPLYSGLGK